MHLPGPLRAAVGLVATAADEAKTLPDRAVELPMLAVSTAMQVSLRAQQRYARLAARGEQVLNRQQPGEDPPAWATFDDDPLSVDDLHRAALARLDNLVDELGADDSASPDVSAVTGATIEDIFGAADPTVPETPEAAEAAEAPAAPEAPEASGGQPAEPVGTNAAADTDATVVPISQAQSAGARTGAAVRKSARKSARKSPAKAPATKTPVSRAAGAPAKKAPAKKAPAKKAPAKKAPAAKKSTSKPVSKPRHGAPSKFDDAGDA